MVAFVETASLYNNYSKSYEELESIYLFYFLQLDREQALVYLQRIKTILDELHAQEVRNKKRVSIVCERKQVRVDYNSSLYYSGRVE